MVFKMSFFNNKWAKRLAITTTIVVIFLLCIKRKDMTLRQSMLKAVYSVIMLKGKIFGNASGIVLNDQKIVPSTPIYNLPFTANNGTTTSFEQFKGKKILLVNTASDCGFTAQYSELENLHQQYKSKLVVIGFPANDFKNQESKDDNAIASFCKLNYGVTFPLAKKSSVIKGNEQNAIFNWLSDSTKNGWCNKQPDWNFSKYLVDENGVLIGFFSKDVSPLDEKIVAALQ
jgi:glutathione peroxidase